MLILCDVHTLLVHGCILQKQSFSMDEQLNYLKFNSDWMATTWQHAPDLDFDFCLPGPVNFFFVWGGG